LVDASAFVTAHKVLWLIGDSATFVFDDHSRSAFAVTTSPSIFGNDQLAGILSGNRLNAGADDGLSGLNKWYGLTLLVATHECSVHVVFLDEWE
jgi:hypothetical protein